jgi:hypothetical protein
MKSYFLVALAALVVANIDYVIDYAWSGSVDPALSNHKIAIEAAESRIKMQHASFHDEGRLLASFKE